MKSHLFERILLQEKKANILNKVDFGPDYDRNSIIDWIDNRGGEEIINKDAREKAKQAAARVLGDNNENQRYDGFDWQGLISSKDDDEKKAKDRETILKLYNNYGSPEAVERKAMRKEQLSRNKQIASGTNIGNGRLKDDTVTIFGRTSDPSSCTKADLILLDKFETSEYRFLVPMTWIGGKYINSPNCGCNNDPILGGAKWCFGWEETDEHWKDHSENGAEILILNKNIATEPCNQKWILEIMPAYQKNGKLVENYFLWDQKNSLKTLITDKDTIESKLGFSIDTLMTEMERSIFGLSNSPFKIYNNLDSIFNVDERLSGLKIRNSSDGNCENCDLIIIDELAPRNNYNGHGGFVAIPKTEEAWNKILTMHSDPRWSSGLGNIDRKKDNVYAVCFDSSGDRDIIFTFSDNDDIIANTNGEEVRNAAMFREITVNIIQLSFSKMLSEISKYSSNNSVDKRKQFTTVFNKLCDLADSYINANKNKSLKNSETKEDYIHLCQKCDDGDTLIAVWIEKEYGSRLYLRDRLRKIEKYYSDPLEFEKVAEQSIINFFETRKDTDCIHDDEFF